MTNWLNVANNAESTLASGITAVATSLTMAAGEGVKFPGSNFNITIDGEILLCTTRTGDVLTVTRAQEGTTAAVHATAAAVSLMVTAGIVSQLQVAVDGLAAGTLKSKVISFTRDLAAATGDVAYTGVGFQPSSLILIAAVNTSVNVSVGMADSGKIVGALFGPLAGVGAGVYVDAFLCAMYMPGDNTKFQTCILKSYNADGFTLTWTKTSTPTGTVTLRALCLR
jgi:hypothetical protein